MPHWSSRHRGIPAARLRAIKADIVRNFADRDLSIDVFVTPT